MPILTSTVEHLWRSQAFAEKLKAKLKATRAVWTPEHEQIIVEAAAQHRRLRDLAQALLPEPDHAALRDKNKRMESQARDLERRLARYEEEAEERRRVRAGQRDPYAEHRAKEALLLEWDAMNPRQHLPPAWSRIVALRSLAREQSILEAYGPVP